MNGAILLLLAIRAPNFRPRFRYFNKTTAVIGIILPLVAMFGINEKMTSIFIGGCWGDASVSIPKIPCLFKVSSLRC